MSAIPLIKKILLGVIALSVILVIGMMISMYQQRSSPAANVIIQYQDYEVRRDMNKDVFSVYFELINQENEKIHTDVQVEVRQPYEADFDIKSDSLHPESKDYPMPLQIGRVAFKQEAYTLSEHERMTAMQKIEIPVSGKMSRLAGKPYITLEVIDARGGTDLMDPPHAIKKKLSFQTFQYSCRGTTMQLVIQRVTEASVKVDDKLISRIGKGVLVLTGVEKGDRREEAVEAARKLAKLRIFQDEQGKMNRSLKDIAGEVLVVSQFTLVSDLRKGCRPSFDQAASREEAIKLLNLFQETLKEQQIQVCEGVFGASMKVALVNDGPVTFTFRMRAT